MRVRAYASLSMHSVLRSVSSWTLHRRGSSSTIRIRSWQQHLTGMENLLVQRGTRIRRVAWIRRDILRSWVQEQRIDRLTRFNVAITWWEKQHHQQEIKVLVGAILTHYTLEERSRACRWTVKMMSIIKVWPANTHSTSMLKAAKSRDHQSLQQRSTQKLWNSRMIAQL